VALSTSSDGGTTWSSPTRANRPTGLPAFTPSVEVNSVGTVGVTYYDMRTLASPPPPLPTDYWLTTSTDDGATFTTETHLAGSFDDLIAPVAGGFFLGDYEGLAAAGTSFVTFFAQGNTGNTSNRTDIVAETVP